MWIPTCVASDGLLLVIGIVDALIFLNLVTAVSIESGYIGKTNDQCAQYENIVFFERAINVEGEDINYTQGLCNSFLSTFYVGLVVM